MLHLLSIRKTSYRLYKFMFYLCSLLLCRLLWSVAGNKSSEELQLTFPFFLSSLLFPFHPFIRLKERDMWEWQKTQREGEEKEESMRNDEKETYFLYEIWSERMDEISFCLSFSEPHCPLVSVVFSLCRGFLFQRSVIKCCLRCIEYEESPLSPFYSRSSATLKPADNIKTPELLLSVIWLNDAYESNRVQPKSDASAKSYKW